MRFHPAHHALLLFAGGLDSCKHAQRILRGVQEHVFILKQATLPLRPRNPLARLQELALEPSSWTCRQRCLCALTTPLAWLQELALEPEPQDPSGRYLVERGESFFTWFDPPDQGVPLAQDIDSTAEALKDDIWPNPYKFYIGEIGLDVGLPPVPPWPPSDRPGWLHGLVCRVSGSRAQG